MNNSSARLPKNRRCTRHRILSVIACFHQLCLTIVSHAGHRV